MRRGWPAAALLAAASASCAARAEAPAPAAAVAASVPAALGRITHGAAHRPGAALCTGALVAPDLVLTAAHCVKGAAADPAKLRFEAGWGRGADGVPRPGVARRGAEVILAAPPPPDPAAGALAGLPADVALLRLSAPVAAAEAAPLPLAPPEEMLPAALALAAFRRDAPEAPASARPCLRLALPPGLAADRPPGAALVPLDCPVVSGNSGAPVLARAAAKDGQAEGWRIAAVAVAAGGWTGGAVRAWAVRVPADLAGRIAARD